MKVGVTAVWYSTGEKQQEFNYGDGGVKRTDWYRNGNKSWEYFAKITEHGQEEREGISTHWYENGQKENELTFIKDEQVGTSTTWCENGQKKSESTYVSGNSHR